MDLFLTLPDFPIKPHAHILPLLDNAGITTKELLLLDALEIARISRAPASDIRKLSLHVLKALRQDLKLGTTQPKGGNVETRPLKPKAGGDDGVLQQDSVEKGTSITLRPPTLQKLSILDPILDSALAGGISTGYVTEVTGESGSGKTQFLLHLLLSVQLPEPHGLAKNALYISTESELATNRLSQLLNKNPTLQHLPAHIPRPSLDNIFCVTTVDLEIQDHVINYQVPLAISRLNIGLVVIDSVTANYRAESSTENVTGLLDRSLPLKRLGHLLRTLAVKHNIAVVVSNQISDGIDTTLDDSFVPSEAIRNIPTNTVRSVPSNTPPSAPASQVLQQAENIRSASPPTSPVSDTHKQFTRAPLDSSDALRFNISGFKTALSLKYQQSFFTGSGRAPHPSFGGGSTFAPQKEIKIPALGLIWTNQIGCRILLKPKHRQRPPQVNNLSTSTDTLARADGATQPPRDMINIVSGNEDVINQSEKDHQPEGTVATKDDSKLQSLQSQESFATLENDCWEDYTSVHASNYQGRLRQMQVLFSPWTSGDPRRRADCFASEAGTGPEIDATIREKVTFDSMYDAVEFLILPQGLKGLVDGS